MAQVIREVNNKFKDCKASDQEQLIIDACYALNYLSDEEHYDSDLVFINHKHDDKDVVSLVIFDEAEYYLIGPNRSNKSLEDLFEDNVVYELAMNCSSEEEAIKIASQYLQDQLNKFIISLKQLSDNLVV
jgi:hypothetical protein